VLDTVLFEQNSAYVRSALVAASAVFKDLGDKSKPQYLVTDCQGYLKKSRVWHKRIMILQSGVAI